MENYRARGGGIPPYQFNWSNGSTDSVLTNVGIGAYSLEVQDANGCISETLNFDLTVVSDLQFTATITEPTCIGWKMGKS